MALPYKLSCVLFGHSADVRSVAVTPDNYIISGSRDKTAKIWKPNGINTGYSEVATFHGHTNFVSAVCYVPPDSEHPSGLVITGSNDQTICVYEPTSSTLLLTLKGHTGNVCSLHAGQTGTFLSASWDKTAKYWDIDGSAKPRATLSGHQAAVWSVIQLETGYIVTGSADKTIRLWSAVGDCRLTLTGHTDCVRGLAATSPTTFLSVANDATIIHWNATTGACLETLYGHTNYIYSVATLPGYTGLVSAAEDWTLKVWQDGDCVQTIALPAQSVWSVACLSNGDIVAGASDGIVRVFSRDESRHAEPEFLLQFDEEVAAVTKTTQKDLGGIDINQLPGNDVLLQPGTKDGQTKLVREGDNVVCYSWSEATQDWSKVGDVMGASGGTQASSGKQLYEGKEYDFVFNVDIEEGKPPLKLPYNLSDDAWSAAQRFIHTNSLSQLFLDQVANFIVDNSKQAQAAPALPTGFGDPLTGGARYIPGGAAVGAPGADPFTGANRYVPPGSTPLPQPTNGVAASAPVEKPYFPQQSYLRFDQANMQVIRDKLGELNAATDDQYRVTEAQIVEVCKLAELDAQVSEEQIAVLERLMDWPDALVFPALDVARMAVRNARVNRSLCSERLLEHLRRHLAPASPPNNAMLAARIAVNMMNQAHGETLALKHCGFLLDVVGLASAQHNKAMQVALSTLLVNLSVCIERTRNSAGRSRGVQVGTRLLVALSDPEAQFRALVALGTLVWEAESTEDQEALKQAVRSEPQLIAKLERLAGMYVASSTSNEAKATNCAAQVLALVQI